MCLINFHFISGSHLVWDLKWQPFFVVPRVHSLQKVILGPSMDVIWKHTHKGVCWFLYIIELLKNEEKKFSHQVFSGALWHFLTSN